MHFYSWNSLYFRYIKRHHLYHHSPKGMDIAFGLTNGFWDIVYDTRISSDVREVLQARPLRNRRSNGFERMRTVQLGVDPILVGPEGAEVSRRIEVRHGRRT